MQKLILQFIYSLLIRNFLKLFVGVKFQNARFLLDEKQFIIVANHNSHLDTLTILASLPARIISRVKPVAAQDHFGSTKFKEKLSNYFINTLLIQRKRDKDNIENDPIHRMIKALDDGYSLILFPEGTRGTPEVQQPLKPGIGYVLSERPLVKYVPAFMKGMGKAMPKDDNLIVPHNSSLVYGPPTTVESNDVSDIVKQVELSINELRDRRN
ncbi:MAG TPA: lysophospholipid acyltransferase family protein [Chryseolinea sp.]|nr:lysophospholipid acyltransferase family protein [Chryseolinea sp.]